MTTTEISNPNVADYLEFSAAATNSDHGYFVVNENGIWWDADGSGALAAEQLAQFAAPVYGLGASQFMAF